MLQDTDKDHTGKLQGVFELSFPSYLRRVDNLGNKLALWLQESLCMCQKGNARMALH